MPQTIWILRITHDGEDIYSAHSSYDLATLELYAYVKKNWDEERPELGEMPQDMVNAIEAYFWETAGWTNYTRFPLIVDHESQAQPEAPTFFCPNCLRRQSVEEVMMDTAVFRQVVSTQDQDSLGYGDPYYDGGYVAQYQCAACGASIKDMEGISIDTPEDLIAYLQFQAEQLKRKED